MGGYGSTRWSNTATKRTVEQCIALAISDLKKPPGNQRIGRITMQYEVRGEAISYQVAMVALPPFAGGRRWLFVCAGAGRGRRVATLYLPPRQKYFACRHCHHLTYASCQNSRHEPELVRLIQHLEKSARILGRTRRRAARAQAQRRR